MPKKRETSPKPSILFSRDEIIKEDEKMYAEQSQVLVQECLEYSPELIAEYYAQSMTFVMMKWIRSGMIISPEEMAEIYEYIVSRSLKEIISKIN